MRRQTKETKVAEKISDLVNDLTLDLDQVGIYLATNNTTTYRRVIEVMEAAKYEKNERIHDDNYLF
jgi:biopolymer transport protein ExbD